ncbi:MAG TPA: hypothetical protein VIY08_06320 [Candidatus Nitrosocosmicus sp.]
MDFTYGNILLLYCVRNKDNSEQTLSSNNNNINKNTNNYNTISSNLPEYIIGRINLCTEIFNVVMSSKPDKFHTSVIIISKEEYNNEIKEILFSKGVPEKYLEYDNSSKTIEDVFNNLLNRITKLANPPSIYFIGSVWQKDTFNSIKESKLGKYTVFFEGALDNRSYDIIQKEKLSEPPKKGTIHYKKKLRNKAIDVLLNYIFPKNKNP